MTEKLRVDDWTDLARAIKAERGLHGRKPSKDMERETASSLKGVVMHAFELSAARRMPVPAGSRSPKHQKVAMTLTKGRRLAVVSDQNLSWSKTVRHSR